MQTVSKWFFLVLFFTGVILQAQSTGTVYIIYGSDTAIWDNMDTGRRHPTYNLSLFTSLTGNATQVMSDGFRNQIRDSYGRPLVMTWWMMAGNIFRDATNQNVPYANLMTLHLIKQYHGAAIAKWGDELSLHYHTFLWSDYDGDGRYWWNQAQTFNESREDFEFTLAQQLVEEDVFPVSFRSGWHFMDNDWQQRLDELLPYSMHNAWPSKKTIDSEPTDNIIDWSRAPSVWIPYHPDPNDYQVPGPGKGWNLRSMSLGGSTIAKLEPAFVQASQGNDQILCLWDHLPDANFLTYLLRVNQMLDTLAAKYSGVKFKFATGVGGMQQFLRMNDSIPPVISASIETSAGQSYVNVTVNEPIFQTQPFIALKTLAEDYLELPAAEIAPGVWKTTQPFTMEDAAVVAVAVTDTCGNLTTWRHAFVPADVFVDDESSAMVETRGVWTTMQGSTWGTTYRSATVLAGDSASVRWSADVTASRKYALRFSFPPSSNACDRYNIVIKQGTSVLLDSTTNMVPHGEWIDLSPFDLTAGSSVSVEITGYAVGTSRQMNADVLRVTPLLPLSKVVTDVSDHSIGYVSLGDTVQLILSVRNVGLLPGTITSLTGPRIIPSPAATFPLAVQSGHTIEIPCAWVATDVGRFYDTVRIVFAEPSLPAINVSISALVELAVRIVDNDVGEGYAEFGTWANSTVTSYGPTSRYAFLSPIGAGVDFQAQIRTEGYYRVAFLVPSSENATNHALHIIKDGDVVLDSVYVSQLPGGTWREVGTYHFDAGALASVRVVNAGGYTSGAVLRADAMKFTKIEFVPHPIIVADNDSAEVYQEFGTWYTSNAQSSGATSRYSNLSGGTGQFARFTFHVWEEGRYTLEYIVPKTVNSSDNALYRISIGGVLRDSVRRDQNAGSGAWVSLGEYEMKALQGVAVDVINDGLWTTGTVLRTDAIRATRLVTGMERGDTPEIPLAFGLDQPYPNPFNPQTRIQFSLPFQAEALLTVHDVLGREVARLAEGRFPAGKHVGEWNAASGARSVSTGVYFIRLRAGDQVFLKKVLLVK